MGLFDFSNYIEELREKRETRETIEKYESYYGPITGDISNQIWYVEYTSKFIPFYLDSIKVPEDLVDDFDWKLLFALIVGSASSEYALFLDDNEQYELEITVKIEKASITKLLSDLWSFQIIRLFEIYIKERIEFQVHLAEIDLSDCQEFLKMYDKCMVRMSKWSKEYYQLTRNLHKKNDIYPEESECLYHYTSFNTLNEILKSNALRASDLRYLNDKNEYKIWFRAFDNVLNLLMQKREYLSYAPLLDRIKDEIDSYKNYDCFITCFSHERDLLSQWKEYGDSGHGIAIGFDGEKLKTVLHKNNETWENVTDEDYSGLVRGNLEYNYEDLCCDVFEKIETMTKVFRNSGITAGEFVKNESEYHFRERCRRIFMRLQDAKDPSFYAEREYRFYWNQKKKSPKKEVKTFGREHRPAVPYVSLSCGDERLPIKEIIIGPSNSEMETMIELIRNDLNLYGYTDVDVVPSEIPYRP